MRKLFTICAALGALSGLGLADTWSGTLLDAHCANKSNQPCYARRSSAHYILDVNGTKYRVDGTTTSNIRSAIVEEKIKTKDGVAPTATIEGRMRADGRIHGHTIAVDGQHK